MGLDASIRCRCWEQGQIPDPPFPRDWIVIDKSDHLTVDEPREKEIDWVAYDKWKDNCCEHDSMRLIDVRIGNWTQVGLFYESLGLAFPDRKRFAVMRRDPDNPEITSANRVAEQLAEIDEFESVGEFGEVVVLIDDEDGREIQRRVESRDGKFLLAGGAYTVHIDRDGLFVRDGETERELFRSRSFEQQPRPAAAEKLAGPQPKLVSERREQPKKNIVVWIDDATGARFESRMAISSEPTPGHFSVQSRSRTAEDHRSTIDALRAVLQMSIETGYPIRWA